MLNFTLYLTFIDVWIKTKLNAFYIKKSIQ